MQSYKDKSNRDADFLISYEWIQQDQKLFQHIRSDFMYPSEEGNQAWCVWPEFVDEKLIVLKEIPSSGLATMWILNQENENLKRHRQRISIGLECYLVVGTKKNC